MVPLGLGWKGYPGDEQSVASYRFTASSLDALRWMSGRTAALGCRDHISVRVLRAAGIDNAAMNGCATWYDIESLGAPSHLPGELRKIVFTPAQRDVYAEQSVLLAQALRKRFPQARLIAAFHRGRGEVDAFTGADDAANTSRIDASLRDAGLEIADLAGSADTFAVYDDADLHVGYRVHAHLYCSSKRRPSILIHEDGRGRGATEALGTLGIDAFRRVSVRASGNALTRRLGSRPPRRTEITASPDVVTNVVRLIDEELASGFARYAGVGAVIDRSYAGMQSFVAALP